MLIQMPDWNSVMSTICTALHLVESVSAVASGPLQIVAQASGIAPV